MTVPVLALFTLALLAQARPDPGAGDAEARARNAEERAFAAVEREEWCQALAAFLEAHAVAPASDLLYNAARAADLGGDRAQAIALYTRALEGSSKGRKAEVKKRLAQLVADVERAGPGAECRAAPEPVQPAVPVEPPAVAAAPAAPPAQPAATSVDVTPREAAAAPTWPSIAMVAGGVGAAGGVVAAAAGAVPWFSYMGAQDALREAEKQGRLDVDGLVDVQASSARVWQTWGKLCLVFGSAVGIAGLVAVGAGVAGVALAPDEATP